MRIHCPICEKTLAEVPDDYAFRPFCSKRCKLIDLGNWFGGRYRIPGEPVDPETLVNIDVSSASDSTPPDERE